MKEAASAILSKKNVILFMELIYALTEAIREKLRSASGMGCGQGASQFCCSIVRGVRHERRDICIHRGTVGGVVAVQNP